MQEEGERIVSRIAEETTIWRISSKITATEWQQINKKQNLDNFFSQMKQINKKLYIIYKENTKKAKKKKNKKRKQQQ